MFKTMTAAVPAGLAKLALCAALAIGTTTATASASAFLAPADTLLDVAMGGDILQKASFAEVDRDAAEAEATLTEAQRYSRARLVDAPSAKGGAQWACLAEAIYYEARGEAIQGQYAVAEVILNRVDSKRYPDTICKVVNQGTGRLHACQFSYTCDGIPERMSDRRAAKIAGVIARELMDGAERALTGDATHYHADYVDPYWNKVYPRTATVGTHIFYKQIPGA